MTLGVAGFINEYSAPPHILPAIAPHLFPDNFNRRGSPRVALSVSISYRFEHTIASATCANISKGGMALRTMNPLASGTKMRLRFRLPGSKKEIDAEALVAWSDQRTGMGLQFLSLDAEAQSSWTNTSTGTSSAIAKRKATGRGLGGQSVPALARTVERSFRAQQPEAVRDDEERRAQVGDDGHPERGDAGDGERHERELEAERDRDVHLHGAQRGAAEADDVGERPQIVRHQRHIGGLDRGVRARHAHRHADIGGRERGRVVDAVADHQHGTVTLAQTRNRAHLVGRKQLRLDRIDTAGAANRMRRLRVIACQQHHVLDPLRAQQLDRLAAMRAQLVAQADRADGPAAARDHHERHALRGHRGEPLVEADPSPQPLPFQGRGSALPRPACGE